jgi:hypothetical protein
MACKSRWCLWAVVGHDICLTLGCTIWNIYRNELLNVWCMCWGDPDLAGFQGWGRGVKYCWNRCSSILAFETSSLFFFRVAFQKTITRFLKMCVFKYTSLITCWCVNKISLILIRRNVHIRFVHLSDPACTTFTQPSFSQQQTISRNIIITPHLITCIDYMFQQ